MDGYKVIGVALRGPMLFAPGTAFERCANGIIATRPDGPIELIPWHEIRRVTLERIEVTPAALPPPIVVASPRGVQAKSKGRR